MNQIGKLKSRISKEVTLAETIPLGDLWPVYLASLSYAHCGHVKERRRKKERRAEMGGSKEDRKDQGREG